MSWTNAVITDAGHALQAALLGTGKGLVFTRAVSGAGLAAGDLAAHTAVTDARQELTMQPAAPLEDAKTRVQAMLSNAGLEAGYTMHQLGFYAKAQDGADEILYALVQDEAGDPIPAAAENPGFTADWTYIFAYGSADSVTVTVDPAGAVPWGAVGAPGGVAPLDGDGKVPKEYLGVQGYQVGDILTTVRTDLDDSWLLCNGELVQRSEYQQLAELFPKRYDLRWESLRAGTNKTIYQAVHDAIPSISNAYFRIYNVLYDNDRGRYVAAGGAGTISGVMYPTVLWVAYTDDLNSGWTAKKIASVSSSGPFFLSGSFVCNNGEFMILTNRISPTSTGSYDDQYRYEIYYPSEPGNILGEWICVTAVSGLVGDRVYTNPAAIKLTFENGFYFIVGQYYDGSVRKYKAALWFSESIDGPYAKQDLWNSEGEKTGDNSPINNIAYDIRYINGEYIVVGYYANDTTITARIGYTADFQAEEWTWNDIYTISNITYVTREMGFIHFTHLNGYFIVSFTYGEDPLENTSTRTNHRILYSENLSEWVDRSYSVGYRLWAAAEITYDNGKYVTAILKNTETRNYWIMEFHVFNDLISSSSRLTYKVVENSYTLKNQDSFSTMWCICKNDKFAVIAIPQGSDEIGTYDIGVIALPTITTDGAYNYIKAKGDDA